MQFCFFDKICVEIFRNERELLMTSDEEIFKKFQERWSLEKVKKMELKDYTGIGGTNRDDFAYWIESELDKLGSIRGGSAFKFGIYKRNANNNKENKRGFIYEKDYAWLAKYGNTKEEAFDKIKSYIIKIIELSQQNKLDEIGKIDLWHLYKWKIAFHYQNIEDMRIVGIFNEKILQDIAKGENLGENLSTAQIYEKLLGDKTTTYTLQTMIQEKSMPLWQKYGKNSQEIMENPMQNNLNTQTQKTIPLNQILYGPPGTGKTYETINKALEILVKFKEIDSIPETRKEQNKLFREFKDKGQIAFITFHQSFSYEEFVEGIKPNADNSQNMIYEVQSGIFKEISERALANYQNYNNSQKDTKDSQIDTKRLFQAYALELKQKLDNGESINFLNKMKIQFINFNQNGEVKSIIIGVDKSPIQSLTQEIISRDYPNFKSGKIKAYKDIKPRYESQSQWHGNAIYYFALYEQLKDFEKEFQRENAGATQKIPLKPYILIIDEINRGNISKILGELITLIEPSKRIGNNEELRVTLPYSQETFGVPNNLYIIGTMNTADRSIALLDTALRRRFEFSEIMPDFTLLNKDCEGVDLQKLLESINHRIEFLLDREHTIGHSFFMKIKFINELKEVFAKKIIPLLQEYFYEDYAKIDAVLNGNGMIESKSMQDLGISLNDEFVDNDKKIYKITDSSKWNEKHFQKIYDNTIKLDNTQNNEA